ncbi:hypothetical protein MKX03_010894 [Papaver bracteatum]|nr:hypothetical protein MKX03_010894 [Papaver bracteatum]
MKKLRFSHRVSSFRTNGKDRDVPEGYYELDPCSQPRNHAVEVAEDDDHYEQESELEAVEVDEDDEQESELEDIKVADPDFYDFFLDKREECFALDQIWAIFDDIDLMPRYYVRIDKVYLPFKVDIAWKRSGLPVACGKFKHDKTDTIEDITTFSHKIFCEKSDGKSFNIYPQKGETWALYKNWNIKWSSNPDNQYEYEYVLVLSDYTCNVGILVAHLVKLKGFVCLFMPTKSYGMDSFHIPSNEMLRFSHRVPSFRTNGKEREDVPEGYFELDTCSCLVTLKKCVKLLMAVSMVR